MSITAMIHSRVATKKVGDHDAASAGVLVERRPRRRDRRSAAGREGLRSAVHVMAGAVRDQLRQGLYEQRIAPRQLGRRATKQGTRLFTIEGVVGV